MLRHPASWWPDRVGADTSGGGGGSVSDVRCPVCGELEDKVVDSRTADDGSAIRRRRECMACGRRFTTFERLETQPLFVEKRSGDRVPFDPERIEAGVQAAAKGRPVSDAERQRLVDDVELEIRHEGPEVSTERIGLAVLERLRALDDVTYMRFASVYKDFDALDDFERELHQGNRAQTTLSTRRRRQPASSVRTYRSRSRPSDSSALSSRRPKGSPIVEPCTIRLESPPTRLGASDRQTSSTSPASSSCPLSPGPPSTSAVVIPRSASIESAHTNSLAKRWALLSATSTRSATNARRDAPDDPVPELELELELAGVEPASPVTWAGDRPALAGGTAAMLALDR